MDYKEKYETALEGIQEILSSGQDSIKMSRLQLRLQGIFPELEELDDEKIRKEIIKFLELPHPQFVGNRKHKEWIAWLEKRDKSAEMNPDEIIEECHQDNADHIIDIVTEQGKPSEWNEVDENEYNHILKILNLVAEEQENKGYNNLISSANWLKSIKDRIQSKQSNKPQGKTALEAIKEEKIDNANKVEPKFKVGDIVQYITDSTDRRKIEEVDTFCNMYHTDSSPIMFEIEDEWKVVVNAEDVEQTPTDKTEPKFKVGDWIIYKEEGGVFLDGRKFAQITKIEGEKHWLDTAITYLKAEDMRLWTLEDAKDGDILYSKKHNLLWRYKNTKECYFCINLNYNSNNISKGDVIVIPNDVKPATKEQRDLLLDKILRQGQHNPTDNSNKIEPIFHEGDWIVVRGEVILICDIRNDLYDVIFADGEHRLYDTNILDKEAHLWTIEDAKDGDVLVASDGSIFIFAGVVDCACKYYVTLAVNNDVIINKEVEGGFWETSRAVHPATKEQCDLLFAKMREKGYKYNNEKKEIIRRI